MLARLRTPTQVRTSKQYQGWLFMSDQRSNTGINQWIPGGPARAQALCCFFISFRRACTSQARGRETLLDTLAWPVACNPPYGQPFTTDSPNPSKLLERRWNLFHKQRPAVDSTPDACCWSSPRIRTEPPHSRTEVNGTVVRSYGGQSGRLKARWSRNMQRCFHHLQRSMRRRLGSSLVPCAGGHGQGAGNDAARYPTTSSLSFMLRAERPRVSSQAGVVSRISGSRGRLFFVAPFSGSRLAW